MVEAHALKSEQSMVDKKLSFRSAPGMKQRGEQTKTVSQLQR